MDLKIGELARATDRVHYSLLRGFGPPAAVPAAVVPVRIVLCCKNSLSRHTRKSQGATLDRPYRPLVDHAEQRSPNDMV